MVKTPPTSTPGVDADEIGVDRRRRPLTRTPGIDADADTGIDPGPQPAATLRKPTSTHRLGHVRHRTCIYTSQVAQNQFSRTFSRLVDQNGDVGQGKSRRQGAEDEGGETDDCTDESIVGGTAKAPTADDE